MFGSLGLPEILLLVLIIILIFGAKRLPDIGRGLGKGIQNFKKALKGKPDEIEGPNKGEEKEEKV
ncbi:twin-arginine translocase TatA/TatE family subunit [bacterium (candidate division B38) B3_B38]|nr:MAG: twin-arginine translocase TatA/TatE family subunit [bacterium (candidate division B38) B3_B38]